MIGTNRLIGTPVTIQVVRLEPWRTDLVWEALSKTKRN